MPFLGRRCPRETPLISIVRGIVGEQPSNAIPGSPVPLKDPTALTGRNVSKSDTEDQYVTQPQTTHNLKQRTTSNIAQPQTTHNLKQRTTSTTYHRCHASPSNTTILLTRIIFLYILVNGTWYMVYDEKSVYRRTY